tara:strand:+ start:1122 stop:1973 length:852 start_codon:yes stop_codon:yes gene_type:complete
MGFFSNVTKVVGDIFEEAGAAVGDVVVESVDFLDPLLGPRGQRGERLGEGIGLIVSGGDPRAAKIGGRIGGAISEDISAAPDVYIEQQSRSRPDDNVISEIPNQQPEANIFDTSQGVYTAGFPSTLDEGTVLDIRYPKSPQATAVGVGMDIIEQVGDYFFGGDDNQVSGTGMAMCKPSMPKAFNVNRQTGCVTITRKQQAKLKEAVRMFGGASVAKNLGISQQLLQQLLLKTFRARRKGISGADIRAVRRVDRQMHSLACALGGISQTSRAVASRKSPPKRSC